MSDSKQTNQTADELSKANGPAFTNEKKIHPWLPEEKFSSICMLFFLFVGFYGIFMVNRNWILSWFVALLFSPKIIKNILDFLLRKKQ